VVPKLVLVQLCLKSASEVFHVAFRQRHYWISPTSVDWNPIHRHKNHSSMIIRPSHRSVNSLTEYYNIFTIQYFNSEYIITLKNFW